MLALLYNYVKPMLLRKYVSRLEEFAVKRSLLNLNQLKLLAFMRILRETNEKARGEEGKIINYFAKC